MSSNTLARGPSSARRVGWVGRVGRATPADALRTRLPLPGFDTAAMDGYAVGGGPGA
ncbi:hypothetical protein [Streptomyces hokutonensis]|uniref:hypothetical protein n=1 Tax=Streptomyces hokutonensis TaxID=1306990 RepID=UPI0003A262C0|nr:hypothetical protein [Streptomyces hokutonensis]